MKGTAKLSIKGFSSKKVDLYGAKHNYSSTYYPHSNRDPKKPLNFACKRAFFKMFIDLWGPSALLSIWKSPYTYALTKETHELDEIIKDKDAPVVVPVIFQALQSESSSVRQQAVLMLNEFTKTKEYAVKGRRQLKIVEMSSDMREAVLNNLSSLIEAVRDENEKVSINAMYILSRFGHEVNVAIPVLKEALKNDDKQGMALQTLGIIAPPQESVPILIDALQSENIDIKRSALVALGQIGNDAREAIHYIIQILADEKENSNIRYNAARCLGRFGSEARPAVPTLILALMSENSLLSGSARKALEAIIGQNFGGSREKWQEWWETQ